MHAITLKQPWAYAVCHLGKRVENRTWHASPKLIGQRVAIHAGMTVDKGAIDWMFERGVMGSMHMTPEIAARCDARGAVIATALLVDSVDERGLAKHDFTGERKAWWIGPIGHVLSSVRPLPTPIPCRGALGYWTLPDDVVAQIEAQEAEPLAKAHVSTAPIEAEDVDTMNKVVDLFAHIKDALSAGSGKP